MADDTPKNPTTGFMWQVVPKRWSNSLGLQPYVEDLSKPIYWSTPRYQNDIRRGDRAFLWRANSDLGPRGIIAIGEVVEEPALSGFARPERVHSNGDEGAESSDWKTGIRLTEVRWNEGMLTAEDLADIVPTLTVLVYAAGTVFRINAGQLRQIERLWIRRRRLAGAA
jgi:hypothetical protein